MFCNEKLGPLQKKLCYIGKMKRKSSFIFFFGLGIIWALNSCGRIQIVPEEKPQQKQVQQEKASPEKGIQKEAPQEEGTREKSFLGKIFQRVPPRDTFTRVYPIDFRSFHPQVLSSLQDFAKAHKGNSFQVQRLGSEDVAMTGVYQGGKGEDRFIVILTLKPAGSKKSSLEIKLTPKTSDASANIERAGESVFQIIEKGTGFRGAE
jgi:hypothetical protein